MPLSREEFMDVMDVLLDLRLYDQVFMGRSKGDPDKYYVGTNANDLFVWGCADSVDITPDKLDILKQAHADCLAANEFYRFYTTDVYSCRVKGMRPQGAVYKSDKQELWPLYDSAGPERETGLGNPYKPGEYK